MLLLLLLLRIITQRVQKSEIPGKYEVYVDGISRVFGVFVPFERKQNIVSMISMTFYVVIFVNISTGERKVIFFCILIRKIVIFYCFTNISLLQYIAIRFSSSGSSIFPKKIPSVTFFHFYIGRN